MMEFAPENRFFKIAAPGPLKVAPKNFGPTNVKAVAVAEKHNHFGSAGLTARSSNAHCPAVKPDAAGPLLAAKSTSVDDGPTIAPFAFPMMHVNG
jgi:hypothetical protein